MANINASTIAVFNKVNMASSSNSAREKAARQQKMDSQVDYWEGKKENLKGKKCGSLDAIKERLELLQSYEDEIAAAKESYNHEQMFHVLDEAKEQGEKIAEELKKYEPKTAEERREEMVEEALGTEENKGEMTESMEELTEDIKELVKGMTEMAPEEEIDVLEELEQEKMKTEKEQEMRELEEKAELQQQNAAVLNHKRINMYV